MTRLSTLSATAMTPLLLATVPPALAQDAGQLNVICSVQAEWCNMIQTVFAKTTGIKVSMSLKGSGEALAQPIAGRANPKTDASFGGTGDPHLQAAEQGLSLQCRPTSLPQLHAWAQQQAANPASSGTASTRVVTLVQLMGEDKAFDCMKALHRNISQYTGSGTGPIKAVARGEATVSISFVHDGPGEAKQGFPVATIAPAEGTGAEIGSMSIIKGTRNLENAKKFYEWALLPQAQQFGAASKPFQRSSNKATPVDARVTDFKKIRFIDDDRARYGASAERKRLISKWEEGVNSLPI